jgi:hypothetical protein
MNSNLKKLVIKNCDLSGEVTEALIWSLQELKNSKRESCLRLLNHLDLSGNSKIAKQLANLLYEIIYN